MPLRIISAALLLLAEGAALAQAAPAVAPSVPMRVSAKALSAVCNENRPACMTYVLGAVDSAMFVASLRGTRLFCFPANFTNDQLTDAGIRYVRSQRQQENANAAVVLLAGLQQSYRCGG